MASFFNLLKIRMGSAGYRRFMRDLADYLGGYLLFFRKSSPEFGKLRGTVNYNVMAYLINESDLKMMNWLYTEMPWKVENWYYVSPKTEEVFVWCLHRGLLNIYYAISQAAKDANYLALSWFVKHKLIPKDIGSCYRGVNNPKVFDFLWENGFVPNGEGDTPFDNGFTNCLNLESYSWYMNHACLNACFDFTKWLENAWVRLNWQQVLKRLMFNIPNPPLYVAEHIMSAFFDNLGDDVLIPIDICQEMPYQYAIQLESNTCQCGDPKNHEERKRRKTKN